MSQAENPLSSSSKALADWLLLPDFVPLAVLQLDRNGFVIRANQAATEIFGYAREELYGQHVSLLWDEAFRRTMDGFWFELIRQPRTYLPCACQTRDSQLMICGWDFVRHGSAGDEDGTVTVFISARDIFTRLAAHAPLGIALVNMQGKPIVVNATLCEMLGYTAEELRLMSFTEFTHPEDADADWALFQELLAGSRSAYTMRKRYVRKDGQIVYALLTVCLLPTGRGSPPMVLGMAANITEQVLAEQCLRRRNEELELFKRALQAAAESIIITNAQGVIQWVNSAFSRITGYSADEALGQTPRLLKSGRHPESFYQTFWKHILSGKTWQGVFLNRKKNGEVYYDERTIAPIVSEDGTITHFVSVGEDVTARVFTELELQRSRDRLRCQAHLLAAAASVGQLENLLPRLLQEAMSLAGVEKGALYLVEGEQVRLRIAQGISNRLCQDATTLPVREVPFWLLEQSVIHEPVDQSGNIPDWAKQEGIQSWGAIPLRLPEGRWLGTLLLASTRLEALRDQEAEAITDVSQHLALAIHHAQLRDELQRTQALLIQRERLHALGQMASGIAHDVNNSLVPVLARAEQLTKHVDSQVRENAREILEAGQDIAQLVRRLRTFHSSQLQTDCLQPVCLNAIVEQCVKWTRPRWKDMAQQHGKTIHLQLQLDPEIPTIAGLPGEIREAIVNLIFNAVDAILAKTDKQGTMVLRTQTLSNEVLVEISDTGVGMDEQTCRRALEPFFTTKGPQGSGLGLPMAFGVMQRHGGQLEIRSTQGLGTTVRLTFPKRPPPAPLPPPATAGAPPSSLHILLVDDDPRVRETVALMLRTLGHRVSLAEDGAQAIRQFRKACSNNVTYHAVLTDLGMPGLSGEDVAREIKQLSPQTPIIVLTGWGKEAKPDVADYALAKPISLADLQNALATATAAQTVLGSVQCSAFKNVQAQPLVNSTTD